MFEAELWHKAIRLFDGNRVLQPWPGRGDIMTVLSVVVCAATGFLVAWALIPVILEVCRRARGERRDFCFHHTEKAPVPRFGGIALAGGFTAVVLAAFYFSEGGVSREMLTVLGCSLAMFGLGVLDDLRPIGARMKLLGQIAIAGVMAMGGSSIEVVTNPFTGIGYNIGLWGVVATVLWLVALTNLINIIDGIDGLAGGISLMLMVLLVHASLGGSSFLLLLAVGMIGALVGFLYFNFPPARIYMGDGGAYFLGFLIGGLTLVTSQKGTVAAALVAPVFALALPILDVGLAIVRRGIKGLPVFRPDRRHIHHRLVEFGFSHRRTLLTLYVLSTLFLLMAFGVFWSQGRLVPLFLGLSFLVVIYVVHSFGLVSSKYSLRTFWRDMQSIRRETRYTMLLAQWLEMEAERCQSPCELWENFVFFANKLELAEVKLCLRGGQLVWQAPVQPPATAEMERKHHDFHGSTITGIELAVRKGVMSPKLFEMKSELAAEAWFKAATRWKATNRADIELATDSQRLVAVRTVATRVVA
ncbi:MAG: MraY family glycosyltransferase [Limisphaerales bacterium]